MTFDPLTAAYATLGVGRNCTPAELKKAYRRLVKIWHPDRYAADPVGQADAEVRMREINRAFRIVAEDRSAPRAVPQPAAPATARSASPRREPPPSPRPGRPLTRAEIDEMVHAIGSPGPLDHLLDGFVWAWPFLLALALVVQYDRLWRGRANGVEVILAVVFVSAAFAFSVRARALRRGGPPTAGRR
jgi:hypothetical protein